MDLDHSYWSQVHPHPLAPDQSDVEVYRNLVAECETVLLLGNTPALMDLCTTALDADPFLENPRVSKGDWRDNSKRFDAIIGDGVLNFTHDLAEELLAMAKNHCTLFVARSFARKLDIMRIADNFPVADDFSISPSEVIARAEYNFFVWRFTEND